MTRPPGCGGLRFGYTMAEGPGALDRLLAEVAEAARGRGLRLTGVVQSGESRGGGHPCDRDLVVLPDGPAIRISQALGEGAQGCRLDPGGLEAAVARVSRRLGTGTELLLVNKFGKQEAAGRGFRDPIAEALGLGVPVLVGVNALNRAAFLEFADGLAEFLEPGAAAILAWIDPNRRRAAA